jgi:hypothetical protein
MAGFSDLGSGNLRASDRDRTKIAAELRIHCLEGRISVEELEYRLALAMSAETIRALAEVVHDLPSIAIPDEQPPPVRRPRIGPPGIRPFTRRIVVPAPAQRTRAVALDTIAPGLNGFGYELKHQSPSGLTFERNRERVVISFEEQGPYGTVMIVHGRAARKVRKAFARLSFKPGSTDPLGRRACCGPLRR